MAIIKILKTLNFFENLLFCCYIQQKDADFKVNFFELVLMSKQKFCQTALDKVFMGSQRHKFLNMTNCIHIHKIH